MGRSKIAEMVEAEAEAAEAEDEEETEDEDAEDAETEADDEETQEDEEEAPAAEWEPLSVEAFQEGLEAEAVRHSEALAALFGPEYGLYEACPVCHLLGVVPPESPVMDSKTQRCEECKGWGQLITEANTPEHRFRQCPACMGNGYVPRIVQEETGAAPVAVEVPPMPVYDAATNTWVTPAPNGAPAQSVPVGAVTPAA